VIERVGAARLVKLTVLVDDCVRRRGLLAEHGLAVWIETDSARVLFDTGQGLTLCHNARALGIDLHATDAIVLSHGHYDHAGGLGAARDCFADARLFVHPSAFRPRYAASSQGGSRPVHSQLGALEEARALVREVTLTARPTQVAPGIWATGPIPRRTEFEDTGGAFYLDPELRETDSIVDDQALVIETGQGSVLLLGCGHAGLVNTLEHVAALSPKQPLRAVLGGFHLLSASEGRINKTVQSLLRHESLRVGPAHCTGLAAKARLLAAFGHRFIEVSAGTSVPL
jgi:7,8-dihydropterin-6-yl-methyl-4-(beta-D-ribofuranosyl)aminobenzene 5'-phosphate synthase